MDRVLLRRDHPRLALRLDGFSTSEARDASWRVVTVGLAENRLVNEASEPGEVGRLLVAPDSAARDLQDEAERGLQATADYEAAFRRARAANALLDIIEERPDRAIYEALHALAGDEERILQLLERSA